jgi:hypothetical protein
MSLKSPGDGRTFWTADGKMIHLISKIAVIHACSVEIHLSSARSSFLIHHRQDSFRGLMGELPLQSRKIHPSDSTVAP